ncbi:MAG: hypothetical protein JO305_07385 [Alphaproteobacteria bacterium]|nr:hypothetical protein [Alphaproteobacteria bacterium]
MKCIWAGFRVLSAVASLISACLLPGAPSRAQSVLGYHGQDNRRGAFTVPGLSWEQARSLRLDATFDGRFSGNVNAQPLYWRAPGAAAGSFLVATEDDTVIALDARSGREMWRRDLGRPMPLSSLPCGNIDPLGITGTPVIDPTRQAIYLDAMISEGGRAHHRIFALSLKDGTVLSGWPVEVADAVRAKSQSFDSSVQNERGALILLNGMVYVPYGGFFGDCGDFHGWVVGVGQDDPTRIAVWRTRARGGGIWAPGGIAADGQSLFVATGNTIGAANWSDGEAVFRLDPDLRHSERSQDFFAPRDWQALDERDADLGGANPIPLDLPGPEGSARALVLALGKDGRGYLLDQRNLGGIGGALAIETVAARPIRTAPAAYPAANGGFVAFQGDGARCPAGHRGEGLVVLKIGAGAPPAIATAWCAAVRGAGAPIVTTTDGHSDPIVWLVGAEGDDRLHGFRGDTGDSLFASAPIAGLNHFQTLLAADGRLIVGADNHLYAFAPP